MTATIHPFRKSSARPRGRASGREACESLPAVTQQQEEALRDARRKLSECWELRAESRRIQRDYEERKLKIEDLMRRYDVEPA
jgi:hypothetical protein